MNPGDPDRAASLGVIVTDLGGRPVRDPGVGAWLRGVAPRTARGTVGLVFAPDAAVRQLNRDYAGHDAVTDVLSFAAGPPGAPVAGRGPSAAPRGAHPWLGDVVIATGVSKRQARAAGHAWRTELRILALHGLLHLLGYDHARDAGTMARVERRLRRRGGLPEALTERAGSRPIGARRRRRRRAP